MSIKYAKTNLRDMVVTMSDGVDVRNTKMLTGEASKDSLHGKNTGKEYVVEAPPKGHLGGKNTRS